jgi:PKD repeat protein
MSPKVVLRAPVLFLLAFLVAGSAEAAITLSPSAVSVGVGETSEIVTANVTFLAGTDHLGGTQTLNLDYLAYYGMTTIPSPVTFTVAAYQASASVSFRIVAPPSAYPGTLQVPVYCSPLQAGTGYLNVTVRPISLVPALVIVPAGTTSETITATLSFSGAGRNPPTGTQQLVFAGLPAGAVPVPNPVTFVLPGQVYWTQATFQVYVPRSVPEGTYEVAVGNSPADIGTASFLLSVRNPGTVTAAVGNASVGVCPGGAAVANSVTVTPVDAYQGTATVTFPSLPSDLVVTPATLSVPAMPPAQTVPFTVAAKAGAATGARTVSLLVTTENGKTATASFTVNVGAGDFTPSVAPSSITINGGGAAGVVTASLLGGTCLPGSNVTVTPSGLPPGVTVTPASAILGMPTFAPVAFSFQASTSAAPGTSTITFAFDPGAGGAPKAVAATLTVCGPPGAPVSPAVKPVGNPTGPVTATDFLALSWSAPASGFVPTRYEWRINGGSWNGVAATSATAPPRGTVDPVQLFVRGYSCTPERGPGAEASSPTYSLAAPTASFSFPTPVVAGKAVTFTDTSSPQATSWLWFPGDGMAATTVQSPTVTFPSAGPKVVVLVATNGSGSSTKSATVTVQAASSAAPPPAAAFRAMEREPDGRLALGRVEVEPGTTLLLRRLSGEGEAVAFLRFLDPDGQVVVERRLVVADGEEARHDLSAWGATGAFRVEIVGPEGLEAVVEERAIPYGGPEEPVRPVRPAPILR